MAATLVRFHPSQSTPEAPRSHPPKGVGFPDPLAGDSKFAPSKPAHVSSAGEARSRQSTAVLTWAARVRLWPTNTAHPCRPFSGSIHVQAETPSLPVALS
jgi:hypothetical protein